MDRCRSKCHLLFKWVDDVMRDEKILDTIEDLIGPDILCWNTLFCTKEPHRESFVSWHQDLNYCGLDTDELVTVWLAISSATTESGCMSVLPGSHKGELMPHRDEYQRDNMLTRGQEIAVEVDESETVAVPLEPGEASLHNGRLAHASAPNRSSERRIGLCSWRGPVRPPHAYTGSEAGFRSRSRCKKAANAVREVLFHGAAKLRGTV